MFPELFAVPRPFFKSFFLALAIAEVNVAASHLEKRAPSQLSIDLQYNAAGKNYYVTAGIGQRGGQGANFLPQTVLLAVSSSPYTWVAGPLRSPTYCDNTSTILDDNNKYLYCVYSNISGTYNPSLSSTFSNSSSYTLPIDEILPNVYNGYFATDELNIGSTIISGVEFGISNNFTNEPSFGLGFMRDPMPNLPPSILSVMLKQNVTGIAAYSVYLNDFDSSGVQLFVGSVDTTKYDGDLVIFDTQEGEQVTTIPIQSMSIVGPNGNATVLLNNTLVDIGFSNNYMLLPSVKAVALADILDCHFDIFFGLYICDCQKRWSNFSIDFEFKGINITIKAHQFIIPAVDNNGGSYPPNKIQECTLLVGANDGYVSDDKFTTTFLGSPFVRGAYILYDYTNNQTSLAPAKLNNTGQSNIVPLAIGGVRDTFNSTTNSTTPRSSKAQTSAGAIAGGVVGGVVLISAIIALFYILRRRRRNRVKTADSTTRYTELGGDSEVHELRGQAVSARGELAVDTRDRKAVNEYPVELDSAINESPVELDSAVIEYPMELDSVIKRAPDRVV